MKIFFCTTAPSKNYKSWSNIPHLLHKNLEKRGYVVENNVMREVEPLKTVFNLPIRVLNKFFKLGTTYFYVRTPVHFFFTYIYSRFIGLMSAKHDVMIVQGFSYPLHNGKNRQIVLGDWPSEYLFEKFLKRNPSRLERKSIDRENAVIEAADAVITLFPNVREYMLRKYKNQNIYCFGNVVNVDDDVVPPADIRERKLNSKRFLFVGQPFYLPGALELIVAARNLRQQGFACEVAIIGIDPGLIGVEYGWLTVHGYLDKEKPGDKQKYYELLSSARLFVNTTPGWSGFQAILEAMYFHNPIVVRPNESLNSYFSNLTSFAHIVEEGGPDLEAILAESLTDNVRYQKMFDAARKAVESSTWNNFTTKLIGLLK
jgi:glycosyltransferase involved in cell wall biosynthesis